MNTLLGLYMAPDGFHVVDTAGGMTFHLTEGHRFFSTIETVLEERYLVAKELIGQKISDTYSVGNNYVCIKVAEQVYQIEFDARQKKRVFKRCLTGEILAIGSSQWSHEQIMAQKHGTLVIFTTHCSFEQIKKLGSSYLAETLRDPISGDIFEHDLFVTKEKCQDFTKILVEMEIPIVKQTLVRALFERLK